MFISGSANSVSRSGCNICRDLSQNALTELVQGLFRSQEKLAILQVIFIDLLLYETETTFTEITTQIPSVLSIT